MKKLILFSALAFGLSIGPKLIYASTPTNTPTNTPSPTASPTVTQTFTQTNTGNQNLAQTQTAIAATATYIATAYPTWTPTLTPTGTLTPAAVPTTGPQQLKSNARERIYIPASEFLASNGTGSATLVQDANDLSAFSFPDSGATMLAQWTVPWNFKGDLHIYALMACQALGETNVSLTVDAYGQHFNMTTQTAGTFSYYYPGAGGWTVNGSSTNVIAGTYTQGPPLWPVVPGTNYPVFSRVLLPIPAPLKGYIYSRPNCMILPGDTMNISIARAASGSQTTYLYGLEIEGDYSPQIPR